MVGDRVHCRQSACRRRLVDSARAGGRAVAAGAGRRGWRAARRHAVARRRGRAAGAHSCAGGHVPGPPEPPERYCVSTILYLLITREN